MITKVKYCKEKRYRENTPYVCDLSGQKKMLTLFNFYWPWRS